MLQFGSEMDQAIVHSADAHKGFLQAPLANSFSCYCKLALGLKSKLCIQPRTNRKTHKTTRQNTPFLPGLPDDLAIACLIRVPRAHHNKLLLVCKRWRKLLSGNSFYSLRKSLGLAEEWVHVIKRDRDGKNSWVAFDPVFNTWHPLPPIPENFSTSQRFGCVAMDGCHLYLFGGKDRLKGSSRQAILYNACTNRWHRVPDMLQKRNFFGCCVINNCIYVAGGEGNGIRRALRSCEMYDPKKNCWKIIGDMVTAMVPNVSVVYDGKWFLKGLGPHREIQCEAYESEKGMWVTMRDNMVVGWRNPTVVINGKLYGLDCHDGCRIMVFDEKSSAWKLFMDSLMHLGNSKKFEATALVNLNGKLCIVRNNMSVTIADISSHLDERVECKPQIWEHIGGKGYTRNKFTSLWSNLTRQAGLKNHIVHCEVLQV